MCWQLPTVVGRVGVSMSVSNVDFNSFKESKYLWNSISDFEVLKVRGNYGKILSTFIILK